MPCTTILVGKKATIDGSLLIARTDDGGFTPKRVVVIPPEKQKQKYKSVIAHLTINLPDNPLRYTCFPFYPAVDALPAYISGTTPDVSTDYMYWQSRLIAVMTDAQFRTGLIHDERYRGEVMNQAREILYRYDERILKGEDEKILSKANKEITDMVKKKSDEVMKRLLGNASEHMKTRYHRGDQ